MNRSHALIFTALIAGAVSVSSLSIAEALAERDGAKGSFTREIPWDGSEVLILGAPAEVRFTQAPGPGKVIVTGPRRSVDTFSADGGVLQDGTLRTGKRLKILVTAPKITRFSAKGGDTLVIENFDQEELHIETTGAADIKASGRAGTVKLHLQGHGWADLSQLQADGVVVFVTGRRNAIIAPDAWAKVSGNGVVILLTHPGQVDQDGEGRVIRAALATESA